MDPARPPPERREGSPPASGRVARELAELAGSGEYAVTIGRFDGVHLGHRHLLDLTAGSARRQGLRSLAITFEPHPEQVLAPDRPPARLTTAAEKAALLAASGVDAVAVLPFTPEFSRWSPERFIATLAATARPRELWVGEDFVFGHRRSGTPERLAQLGREHGFAVHRVPRIRLHGTEMIGTTNIRRHILEGNVALAAHLLGRHYALHGIVVHGAKRGRALGYPTANLDHPAELVVPTHGIYATLADVPGVVAHHASVTSIGVRPVFDNGARLVETHLLDWSGDLYDRPLTVQFLEWLRPEERFSSVEALIEQMDRDSARARSVARDYLTRDTVAAPVIRGES
jgi:riboflavin kinase/FMN adenylyltransferase